MITRITSKVTIEYIDEEGKPVAAAVKYAEDLAKILLINDVITNVVGDDEGLVIRLDYKLDVRE